jgi:hypothetical protein
MGISFPFLFVYLFFCSFIHMCIHCLGHFSTFLSYRTLSNNMFHNFTIYFWPINEIVEDTFSSKVATLCSQQCTRLKWSEKNMKSLDKVCICIGKVIIVFSPAWCNTNVKVTWMCFKMCHNFQDNEVDALPKIKDIQGVCFHWAVVSFYA